MNPETATPEPETDASSNGDAPVSQPDLDVLVIDNWLVFDCPSCQQTIKIDRADSVYAIECPSCAMEFEPLLEKAARNEAVRANRKDETKGDATSARVRRTAASVRRRMKEERQSKPLADLAKPGLGTLPEKGHVTLAIQQKMERPASSETARLANLPKRSAAALETRIVAATQNPLHPTEEGERLITKEVEELSGGDYKRVRVRTRVKKQTEVQSTIRFWMFFALATMGLAALGLTATKLLQKRRLASKTELAAGVEAAGPAMKTWEELLKQLDKAKAAPDLLPLIRYPSRLEKPVLATYPNGIAPLEISQAVPKENAHLPPGFQQIDVISAGTLVPLYFERTKAFGWRLDWESWVGHGSMPWKQFIESRQTETQRLRAIASQADLWQGDFTDQESLFCVRLEDATRKHILYGYCPKFSVATKKLQSMVIEKQHDVQVMVDIRFPRDAKNDNQVEIVHLARDNWVMP